MKTRFTLFALVFQAVAAGAITLGALTFSSQAIASPAQVLIIRHGEKPDSGGDLSPRGWQRAYALVSYFEANPQVTRFGTPVALYAMAPKDDSPDSSRRAIETLTPLSQALHLPIIARYKREEIKPLIKEIMGSPQYNGRMVLICWEHKMIPELAAQFGVRKAPDKWPKSIFDAVWEIDRPLHPSDPPGFRLFWQHLLPGDHGKSY